ncbi:MAG: YraN family protein [bacterium]
MPSPSQIAGSSGEAQAEAYLRTLNYQIIDHHYTCRYGEIDLIALDSETLVFVEVKLRRSNKFGTAEESVNQAKQEKLIQTIENYRNEHPEYLSNNYRFDLITINPNQSQPIRHLANLAFTSIN